MAQSKELNENCVQIPLPYLLCFPEISYQIALQLAPPEGDCSKAMDAFGLIPPSQLVIGYYWLAFLNQVCRVEDALVKFPIHS